MHKLQKFLLRSEYLNNTGSISYIFTDDTMEKKRSLREQPPESGLETVGALCLPIMGYKSLLVVPVADQILCKHSMQSKRLIQNLRSETWDLKSTLYQLQMPRHSLVALYTNATVLQRRHRNSYTPVWNKPTLIHFKTLCPPREAAYIYKNKRNPSNCHGILGMEK